MVSGSVLRFGHLPMIKHINDVDVTLAELQPEERFSFFVQLFRADRLRASARASDLYEAREHHICCD